MYFTIITVFTALIFVAKFEWNNERNRINKKFNPQNIETIKKELFNNYIYNEEDIRSLLGGYLNKKELMVILSNINQVVDKEELLNKFETLTTRQSDDITDPYNLISTIDKIIDDLKEKEKELQESKIRKINKTNLELLHNEIEQEKVMI